MIGNKLSAELLYGICSAYAGDIDMIELVSCPNTSVCYMSIDKAMASGFNKIINLADKLESGWVEFTKKKGPICREDEEDPIMFLMNIDDGIVTNMFTCYEIYSAQQ